MPSLPSRGVFCSAAGCRQRPQLLHLPHELHALQLLTWEVSPPGQLLHLTKHQAEATNTQPDKRSDTIRRRRIRRVYCPLTTNSLRSLLSV